MRPAVRGAALALFFAAGVVCAAPVRIALAGDSTVAEQGGWGPGLRASFGPEAEVINLARNGRSSKSFRAEGLWAQVLAAKPRYVLIQFGHNDVPGKGPGRETVAETTYRQNMARFIDEARAAGAEPILVTSIVRRNFTPDGRIKADSLVAYVEQVRSLAAAKKTPLIDLYTLTKQQAEMLGPEGCAAIDARDAEGKPDHTHLGPLGQQEIGAMAARELVRVVPVLKPHLLPASSTGIFNILDFGASRDASASSTAAIRAAIQACARNGGGTVRIPAGQYTSGAIELVSNMTLEVQSGAVVHFVANREEYPLVPSRFEGTETRAPAAMIGGHHLQNVTITGRGTLTADNAEWRKLTGEPAYRTAWQQMLALIEGKAPVPDELRRTAEMALRADFIRPVESKNVLIEGIHIVGSPMWVLHILYCENVVIRNVVVETFPGANTDGVDIDSCKHVRISDSYFDTGDDAICIKSGKDVDGRRVGRATEDIAITNCTIHRGHGAVVLGSENSGNIRNVVASNIVAQGTDRGIRIKSGRARGGVIENIRFDNWVIEDTPNPAIEVTNYYTRVPAEPVSERTPVFRNIAISNVTINRCKTAVSIEGLPEMPIEGLRLSDIIATVKEGLRAFNTKGLELHNVRIDADGGIPFLIRDSVALDLNGVQTRSPKPGLPVVRIDSSREVTVRNSIAWTGTPVFLSVAPGVKVSAIGNDFSAAGKATVEVVTDYWKGIATPDRR